MTPSQIAETLRSGAAADIWYDAVCWGEPEKQSVIDDVQRAMLLAADILAPGDETSLAIALTANERRRLIEHLLTIPLEVTP